MRVTLPLAIIGALMTSSLDAGTLAAVVAGDRAALQAAIAAGQPVDERDARGRTALLIAVWNDDLDSARQLIAAGADVNARDSIRDSPFLVAGAHGRDRILRLILQNGADLASTNRYGGTALIPAAEKGHPETVSILIDAGVDVNHVNDLGWTALLEAVVLSDGGPVHQDIVRRLLAGGADRDIPDRDGVTALEHARQRGQNAMVRLLQ